MMNLIKWVADMKRVVLILLAWMIFLVPARCQENEKRIVVDCQTPGTLSTLLTYVQQQNVEELYVSGYINKTDIQFVNRVIEFGNLNVVDFCNAMSTDGYVTFSFSRPTVWNEEKQEYQCTNPVHKISMPKTEEFWLSLGGYADTIQINSRMVVKANNVTGGYQVEHLKKIVLGEGVEKICNSAFINKDGALKEYIIDSFPQSLKVIENEAFIDYDYKYREPKPSCFFSPDIEFPENIEQIGSTELNPYGYSYGSWCRGLVVRTGKTIVLPNSLKIFNGTNYSQGTPYATTKFVCDTLIVPKSMEFLSVGVDAKVMICDLEVPPLQLPWNDTYIDKLYVPKASLAKYEKLYDWDVDVNDIHVKNILPIIDVTKVQINGSNVMYVGESIKLTQTIFPDDALYKSVVWRSSDESIASVDGSGMVKGISSGNVVITAEAENGVKGTFEIEVRQHVTGIKISQSAVTIENGGTMQLTCEVLPATAYDKTVTWKSTLPEICHVAGDGTIVALNPGKSVITVTTADGGFSADCVVTVNQPVESVDVTPKNISLEVNGVANLSVSVLPVNATDKTVTWTSSDESVVSVDTNGRIKGLRSGTAEIYAVSNADKEKKDFCKVTVIRRVEGISLNVGAVDVLEGESVKLTAEVHPEDATDKTVRWTSSDINVAVVASDGSVYGIKEGQAVVMATTADGGFVDVCRVNVVTRAVLAQEIKLNVNTLSLVKGEAIQLHAQLWPDNVTNRAVKWVSENDAIATVNDEGNVNAVAKGATNIKAVTTDGSNLTAICGVTVTEQSGLDSIRCDADGNVRVYNIEGQMIYDGKYSDMHLSPGLYLMKSDDSVVKIYIR